MALHIHTQDSFNNHTAHSLYMIMVIAPSAMGVMKMGNTVHRAGTKPTSLSLWASVLHLVGSLMSSLHPRPPVYVALSVFASEVSVEYYNIKLR